MIDISWTLVLYRDLLVFSVTVALTFACTQGHAHNWITCSHLSAFELLAHDCLKTSYRGHIQVARLILSSLPYYILLTVAMHYGHYRTCSGHLLNCNYTADIVYPFMNYCFLPPFGWFQYSTHSNSLATCSLLMLGFKKGGAYVEEITLASKCNYR